MVFLRDEKCEQEEDKELSVLVETFSTIQESLRQLQTAATGYKDLRQAVSRLRRMNKLLDKQLLLLDKMQKRAYRD